MTLLSKTTWAMQKKQNKRCLPKEGRPHAHGVCQKKEEKRKDAYPKKVCHMLAKACQKKEEKMLISHGWK